MGLRPPVGPLGAVVRLLYPELSGIHHRRLDRRTDTAESHLGGNKLWLGVFHCFDTSVGINVQKHKLQVKVQIERSFLTFLVPKPIVWLLLPPPHGNTRVLGRDLSHNRHRQLPQKDLSFPTSAKRQGKGNQRDAGKQSTEPNENLGSNKRVPPGWFHWFTCEPTGEPWQRLVVL